MLVSANANYTSRATILFIFPTEFSFHPFLVYYKHNYFNPPCLTAVERRINMRRYRNNVTGTFLSCLRRQSDVFQRDTNVTTWKRLLSLKLREEDEHNKAGDVQVSACVCLSPVRLSITCPPRVPSSTRHDGSVSLVLMFLAASR